MIEGCPGAQQFRQPHPENVVCPFCGEDVEIWSDEFSAACPQCGKTVSRGGQSCLDWCKAARECVGDETYKKYTENKKRREK